VSAPADNVVRLPRDWLGPKDWLEPRDELVPLGRPTSPPPQGAATPQGADAFWSESSAAIQDAVQAPDWGAARGQDGSEDVRAGRAGIAILGRLRLSRRDVLVAGAVALVCMVSLIGLLQPERSTTAGRPVALAEHRLQGSTASAASSSLVAHHSQPRHRGGQARATAIARERPSSHASAIRSRPSDIHPDSAAPTGARTVAVSQPVTPSVATTQAASPAADTSAGSSGAGSSSGGAQASSASGPVGMGAPFGPGHLG
jgi:hypothetical protein